MTKAVLFVLFLSGAPAEHFDTAFDCNQAAVQAVDLRAECRSFDDEGNEVVFKEGPVTYVKPGPFVPAENHYVIEVR